MNNVATRLRKVPAGRKTPRGLGIRAPGVSGALRVLLVENCVHDELALINELHCGGFEVNPERVETMSQFRAALSRETWDVIICDYFLCASQRGSMLQLWQKLNLDIPFIVVSAVMGEELAVETLKAGASDYVLKQNLSRLVPAIRRELCATQERQIRKRTEAAQTYLASVVESCHDAIVGQTTDGKIVTWNRGAERLYGYCASEMIGRSASMLIPWYRPDAFNQTLEALGRGELIENASTVRIRKDGSEVEVSVSVSPVMDASGQIIGTSTVARDITQWKQEETERLSLIQELTTALATKNQLQVAGGDPLLSENPNR